MGVDGDEKAPQLPKAIPFTTFQSLEKDAGPGFMEIAIDYAEAMRNARDLTKLAKLTKQKVTVSSKEPGKPRMTMEIEYGAAEGSNLGSTKEYSSRAFQEAVGATSRSTRRWRPCLRRSRRRLLSSLHEGRVVGYCSDLAASYVSCVLALAGVWSRLKNGVVLLKKK